MAEWATIYASLPSKSVPSVDQYANTAAQLRVPRPSRPEISSICVEIDSEASTSEDEDEYGYNQSNMYGGTSIQRGGEGIPDYGKNAYLKPPQPIRHRPQNQRHHVQQHYQQAIYSPSRVQPMQSESHPNPPNRHRSPSLPPLYRNPCPSPAELPVRSASSAKPRKHRPTPLELAPPRFPGSFADHKTAVASPYSPGILSLYSPEQALSPQSRTRSLPIYTFRPCDLPSPSGGISIPSPLLEHDRSPQSSTTSFSSIFSPGISPGSVDSGRISLSPDEMHHRIRHYI